MKIVGEKQPDEVLPPGKSFEEFEQLILTKIGFHDLYCIKLGSPWMDGDDSPYTVIQAGLYEPKYFRSYRYTYDVDLWGQFEDKHENDDYGDDYGGDIDPDEEADQFHPYLRALYDNFGTHALVTFEIQGNELVATIYPLEYERT